MNEQPLSREEMLSVLFAEMVVQQTNMAMIFLGKTPHPQTGKTHQDLAAARIFIDQLEMLEVKTKGNLTKDEESLLKQSLGHLRLSYVDAANQKTGEAPKSAGEPAAKPAEAPTPEASPEGDETRKRFTKKY